MTVAKYAEESRAKITRDFRTTRSQRARCCRHGEMIELGGALLIALRARQRMKARRLH